MEANHSKSFLSSTRRIARGRGRHLPALALSLMLMILAGPAMAQDEDDSSDIGGAMVQDLMTQLLKDRGLAPPAGSGLSFNDYIDTNAGEKGLRRVWVSLGPDGNIIPKEEWRDQHKTYCKQRAREMVAPAQRLGFKLYRNVETDNGLTRYQYDVWSRLIDDKTDVIKIQKQEKSTIGRRSDGKSGYRENPDAEGLAGPMDAALDALNVKLGALVDACGEVQLRHVSGDQVKQPVAFEAGFQSFGNSLKYAWDFGDGSTTSGVGMKTPNHTYAEKGTYVVTVKVTGEHAKPGSKTISVVIKAEEEEDKTSAIQPRDGTWQIKLIDLKTHGCSARIAGAIKSSASKMVGENRKESLTFAKPFHPKPLMKHDAKLVWRHTGLNKWTTTLAKRGSKSMEITADLAIEVISPTLIKEVGTTSFKVSAALAGIISQSGNCYAVGNYEATWLK